MTILIDIIEIVCLYGGLFAIGYVVLYDPLGGKWQ